jgi:protein-tyrosine phosphatase
VTLFSLSPQRKLGPSVVCKHTRSKKPLDSSLRWNDSFSDVSTAGLSANHTIPKMKITRILFVCTGNICRSPTAEGVMRTLLESAGLGRQIEVDSAGTHGYHIGELPDPRTQKAALRRGYDLSALRARKVALEDFTRFDHVLAMDAGHLHLLRRVCPPEHHAKLSLFLHKDVPDPYYGDAKDFERVLDLAEEGARAWIARLTSSD